MVLWVNYPAHAAGQINREKRKMPLFFQDDINRETRLAVWEIKEAEEFFLQLAIPQREVLHPHKRLQHLAGRYLLRHLFPAFPTNLIQIADTRKPFLENEIYHFSISHCGPYAAAIVSAHHRVGIDIEVVTEKATRIRHKFASDEEWALVQQLSEAQLLPLGEHPSQAALLATLIWSCKEAVFKWYGEGEVDFRQHMPLIHCSYHQGVVTTTIAFQKYAPQELKVTSRLLDHAWLSVVAETKTPGAFNPG